MLRALFAASLVALLAGCAHKPELAGTPMPQVNRAVKADKYAAPKKAAPVEAATPNGVVKKRWSWPHPSWLSK
jgi:hypothetical protein